MFLKETKFGFLLSENICTRSTCWTESQTFKMIICHLGRLRLCFKATGSTNSSAEIDIFASMNLREFRKKINFTWI